MYPNYYSLELNKKHMILINYLNEMKKITKYYLLKLTVFIKIKVSIFLKNFLHYSLKIIKFTLPYKLIKKLTPYTIKVKIRILLLKHPNLTKKIKHILVWIKESGDIKSNYLMLILRFLVKKFFLLVLKILLYSFEIKKIIYYELSKNTNFQERINREINSNNTTIIGKYKLINEELVMNEDCNLSLDTHEVYQKMQFYFSYYQIKH